MIKYRTGLKYQLIEDSWTDTLILPPKLIDTKFIRLEPSGRLLCREGYAWDGPSGPTIDTEDFMHGSLVHDAFYQLIREGHLPQSYKEAADKELVRQCKIDGMWAIRRWWVLKGVQWFGDGSCKLQKEEY